MDEMGKSFWLKMIGMVIGLGLLVLVSVLLVDRLVYRFGVWGGSWSSSASQWSSPIATTRRNSRSTRELPWRREGAGTIGAG